MGGETSTHQIARLRKALSRIVGLAYCTDRPQVRLKAMKAVAVKALEHDTGQCEGGRASRTRQGALPTEE